MYTCMYLKYFCRKKTLTNNPSQSSSILNVFSIRLVRQVFPAQVLKLHSTRVPPSFWRPKCLPAPYVCALHSARWRAASSLRHGYYELIWDRAL